MTAQKKKIKVLVSDSVKNSREAVTEIFSEAGYHVSSARSGSETIDSLTRENFDLVFCDIDMPGKSNLEIVRMARALNEAAQIIVASSASGKTSRRLIMNEGAFELLDKPLRRVTLLGVARKALSRRPARKKMEVP